jgi:hypothetical protein
MSNDEDASTNDDDARMIDRRCDELHTEVYEHLLRNSEPTAATLDLLRRVETFLEDLLGDGFGFKVQQGYDMAKADMEGGLDADGTSIIAGQVEIMTEKVEAAMMEFRRAVDGL